ITIKYSKSRVNLWCIRVHDVAAFRQARARRKSQMVWAQQNCNRKL
ncbi:hypothetical protein A2U01_0055511, partial [Trifolium medium]|nr:hypothetical protein [Trifolium medium]